MNEIKERPDAPGLWERDDGTLYDVAKTTKPPFALLYCVLRTVGMQYVEKLPSGRYRLRTLDPLPWPAEPKVETRWINFLPNWPAAHYYDSREDADEGAARWERNGGYAERIGCVPVQCEVDGEGRVVRVLPVEEK